MGLFGKQIHYCPNCGKRQLDGRICDRTKATMCSQECLEEWELKYARMLLGKSEEDAKCPQK